MSLVEKSWVDKVRGVLAQGEGTVRELAARLDVPEADRAGRERVRFALADLHDQGEAAYRGSNPRKYRLAGNYWGRAEKQEKLWRAMCLAAQKAAPFTVADLVLLTGADRDYAKRYVRFCANRGLIRPVGKKVTALVYRMTPGQERQPAPRWNRRAEKRARQGSGVRGQESGKSLLVAALEANCTRLGRGDCVGYPENCGSCELLARARLARAGEILADMETVLATLSGETLLLKGFLREMRGALGLENKEAGHDAVGQDQP